MQATLTDKLKKTEDAVIRTRYEVFLGKRVRKEQWVNLRDSILGAGFQLDEHNLKLFASLKSLGCLTTTNAKMVTDIKAVIATLEKSFTENGRNINEVYGGEIWEVIQQISQRRLNDGQIQRIPNDSTLYGWFREIAGTYKNTKIYNRDEVYALIVRASTYKPKT